MEWLTQVWQLIRDVALTGLGLFVIYHQALAPHPDPVAIGAGLAILSPAGAAAVKRIYSAGGSHSSSQREPSAPSSASPGGTDER